MRSEIYPVFRFGGPTTGSTELKRLLLRQESALYSTHLNFMQIIVETFHNRGEPSSSEVRVRPLVGQFEETYRVWCSKAMRRAWPVGELFRVWVSRVDQPDGESYLRIGLNDPWEPVSLSEAERFIREQHKTRG